MASETSQIAHNASIILAGMINSQAQVSKGMVEEAVALAREIEIQSERSELAPHGMVRVSTKK